MITLRVGLNPSRWMALVGLLVATPLNLTGQSLGEAVTQLRTGQYPEALRSLERLAGAADAAPDVQRAYARALMEVGRYDDARRAVAGSGGRASNPEVENVLGEALYALGRIDEAETAFRQAMENEAADRNVARLNLGTLLWERGQKDEASGLFDTFFDLYNRASSRLSGEDLTSVGQGMMYLGISNPDLYQDALMAFDEAAEADPADPLPSILTGELFLGRYRATDARDAYRPVLERNGDHPRALLGQAKILDFEGAGGAVPVVQRALEISPGYVDARAFLAQLHLKTEDYDQARAEAETGLEINPNHLPALSVLAATELLTGNTAAFQETRDRILNLNPVYADLYAILAERSVDLRMYQEAVDFAAQAVALDSTSWRGFGILGMNQLRTNAIEDGRRNLEIAFQGDPYNPWYKNTLDLLDKFGYFRTVPTQHFELFLFEEEADLLAPYAAQVAEEAYAALKRRYGAEPPTPIRLEIFPDHADFSVRTLGLTGLGALGVSFGSTLVMDSPSARDPGEFNWASTLWHEVAHAFHLAMTDHRVPRWFTEGLAVHEQHKARGHWGHRASPAWLQAYAAERLHPVSRLNQGFIRPEYPQQVVFSYFQASLVMDLIESRWGLDALLAMMRGYREGKANDEVFRETLGQRPEEFDETFDAYVQQRYGDRIQAVAQEEAAAGEAFHLDQAPDLDALRAQVTLRPGSFLARLSLGRALFQEERFEEAQEHLREALRLFPEYGGPDSPYLYLAQIHRQEGDLERAARALQQLGGLSETLFPVHALEAELRSEMGDREGAARALEKAVEVSPFHVDSHRTLASLYSELAEHEGEVLERRAILALDPPDRADAHYRLAVALLASGNRAEARTQVLRALEIAPNFEAALDLLLELRGGTP